MEQVARLVVLHDRSAVGSGEPHGVADDAVQNFVEVEARADGLAHLTQSLQLGDLACQLGAPGLECAHQVDLSQHDRTLNGELFEELSFPHVEGRDFGAPHGQHAHDLVLQDHRRGKHGAKTGKPLEVVASVLRVAEHVGNLMGTPVLGRAPDGGRTVPGNRVFQEVLEVLLRDFAGDPRETEHVALEEKQLSDLRSAQSRGVFDDGVQYNSGVGDVAAEGGQDLAARRGLLAGVSQLLALRGQTLDRSSSARPRSLLHRRTRSARRVFARIDHSSLRAGLISVCAFTLDGAGPLAISTPPGHTRVLGRMVFAFSTNSMRSHTPVVSCARSR